LWAFGRCAVGAKGEGERGGGGGEQGHDKEDTPNRCYRKHPTLPK